MLAGLTITDEYPLLPFSILLTNESATIVQGAVTGWNDDGFTITMTNPGSLRHILVESWAVNTRKGCIMTEKLYGS